jgi:DNA-binding HxlR family transcriptional regulator
VNRDATDATGERVYSFSAYFENEFGEMLVFLVEQISGAVRVYHSDLENRAYTVEESPNQDVHVPGIILNRSEKLWLSACWEASIFSRKGKKDKSSPPEHPSDTDAENLSDTDAEDLAEIVAAYDHIRLGLRMPLLKALQRGGPMTVAGLHREGSIVDRSKKTIKDRLEDMKAKKLVECDPYINGRPQFWWITPEGIDAIPKYEANVARGVGNGLVSMILGAWSMFRDDPNR